MLDTDTCSYIMREQSRRLLQSMQARVEAGDDICVSVITYSELRLGAARSQARQKYDRLIDALSDRLDFIAEHALSLGHVLVTNNKRHFSTVEGLALVNWADPQE